MTITTIFKIRRNECLRWCKYGIRTDHTHRVSSFVYRIPLGDRYPLRHYSCSSAPVASCRCTAIVYNCASSYRRGTRCSGPSRQSNTSRGTRTSTPRRVYADAGLGSGSNRRPSTASICPSSSPVPHLKNDCRWDDRGPRPWQRFERWSVIMGVVYWESWLTLKLLPS